MAGPFTSAVPTEWHNLDGVGFGVVRSNFPPVANLEARRNHCSQFRPMCGAVSRHEEDSRVNLIHKFVFYGLRHGKSNLGRDLPNIKGRKDLQTSIFAGGGRRR